MFRVIGWNSKNKNGICADGLKTLHTILNQFLTYSMPLIIRQNAKRCQQETLFVGVLFEHKWRKENVPYDFSISRCVDGNRLWKREESPCERRRLVAFFTECQAVNNLDNLYSCVIHFRSS